MKYGEYLKDHLVPGWNAHYMDYNGLKEIIENSLDKFDEQAFVKRVMEEEKRVDFFIAGKIAEVVNNLRFL